MVEKMVSFNLLFFFGIILFLWRFSLFMSRIISYMIINDFNVLYNEKDDNIGRKTREEI